MGCTYSQVGPEDGFVRQRTLFDVDFQTKSFAVVPEVPCQHSIELKNGCESARTSNASTLEGEIQYRSSNVMHKDSWFYAPRPVLRIMV